MLTNGSFFAINIREYLALGNDMEAGELRFFMPEESGR